MKKTFFSIFLLIPFFLQAMENPFSNDSKKLVKELFTLIFSDIQRAQEISELYKAATAELQELEKKESDKRVMLALSEARMNGICAATIDKNIVKLGFLDIDPVRNKLYVCPLQSANKKIENTVSDFNTALVEDGGLTNNWGYYETLLKKKLAGDPDIEITEDYLIKMQMSRFMEFRENRDLNAFLKKQEEQLKLKSDDFFATPCKVFAMQKIKDGIKQIKLNRFSLQKAFLTGDATSINNAISKNLHISPYVPLLEYVKNLRNAAIETRK